MTRYSALTRRVAKQDADIITSGVFDLARIPVMDDDHIPNINTLSGAYTDAMAVAAVEAEDPLTLAGKLELPAIGVDNGIVIGGDTHLYRYGVAILGLAAGDNFRIIDGELQFAHDTNLYRSAADILKTDDVFDALSLRIGATQVISSARVLQNVTANASIITAGTFAEARIPHSFDDAMYFNNTYTYLETALKFQTPDGSGRIYIGANAALTDALYFWDATNSAININFDEAICNKILFDRSNKDVSLYRDIANRLKTDDAFWVVGLISAQGGIMCDAVRPSADNLGTVGVAAYSYSAMSCLNYLGGMGLECYDDLDDLGIIMGLKKSLMKGKERKYHYACESFPEPLYVPPTKEDLKQNPDCHGQINLTKIIALELGAIRQLNQKVEDLKKEVEQLRGEVN